MALTTVSSLTESFTSGVPLGGPEDVHTPTLEKEKAALMDAPQGMEGVQSDTGPSSSPDGKEAKDEGAKKSQNEEKGSGGEDAAVVGMDTDAPTDAPSTSVPPPTEPTSSSSTTATSRSSTPVQAPAQDAPAMQEGNAPRSSQSDEAAVAAAVGAAAGSGGDDDEDDEDDDAILEVHA